MIVKADLAETCSRSSFLKLKVEREVESRKTQKNLDWKKSFEFHCWFRTRPMTISLPRYWWLNDGPWCNFDSRNGRTSPLWVVFSSFWFYKCCKIQPSDYWNHSRPNFMEVSNWVKFVAFSPLINPAIFCLFPIWLKYLTFDRCNESFQWTFIQETYIFNVIFSNFCSIFRKNNKGKQFIADLQEKIQQQLMRKNL